LQPATWTSSIGYPSGKNGSRFFVVGLLAGPHHGPEPEMGNQQDYVLKHGHNQSLLAHPAVEI